MARARPLPCAGAFRTGPGEESGTSAAPHSGAPRVGLHSSRSHSQCSAPAGSPWGPGWPQAWHLEVRGALPHVRGMGTLTSSFQDSGLRPEPTALVSTRHTSQASSTHSQPRTGVSAELLPLISLHRRSSLQRCHTWDLVSETPRLWAPKRGRRYRRPKWNLFPSRPIPAFNQEQRQSPGTGGDRNVYPSLC